MWSNIKHLLDAVIPVAEASSVRLALHPEDPPVLQPLGGVGHVTSTLDQYEKIFSITGADSSSSGSAHHLLPHSHHHPPPTRHTSVSQRRGCLAPLLPPPFLLPLARLVVLLLPDFPCPPQCFSARAASRRCRPSLGMEARSSTPSRAWPLRTRSDGCTSGTLRGRR